MLVVILAVGVLLAACGSDDPAAGCDVDVQSADLQQQAERAGLPGCPPDGGDADLTDVALPCLGRAAAIDVARRSKITYPSLAEPCGALQETDLVIGGLPQFVFVEADGSVEQAAGDIESVAEMVDLAEQRVGITLKGAA